MWFAYRNIPIDTGDGKNGKGASRAGVDSHTKTEPDWVLRDVSFVIEPGETVAIVGHTGAGKTTIISLLMRFYDVQKGAIKIDGVNVKDMDLADLRRRFGVVLQDPFLFTGTVEGNIRLGTQFITDEDVQQAAIDVCAFSLTTREESLLDEELALGCRPPYPTAKAHGSSAVRSVRITNSQRSEWGQYYGLIILP